jgi:hypothetical protein
LPSAPSAFGILLGYCVGLRAVRRNDGTLVHRSLLGVDARAFGRRWDALRDNGGGGGGVVRRTTGTDDARAPGNDWRFGPRRSEHRRFNIEDGWPAVRQLKDDRGTLPRTRLTPS